MFRLDIYRNICIGGWPIGMVIYKFLVNIKSNGHCFSCRGTSILIFVAIQSVKMCGYSQYQLHQMFISLRQVSESLYSYLEI